MTGRILRDERERLRQKEDLLKESGDELVKERSAEGYDANADSTKETVINSTKETDGNSKHLRNSSAPGII